MYKFRRKLLTRMIQEWSNTSGQNRVNHGCKGRPAWCFCRVRGGGPQKSKTGRQYTTCCRGAPQAGSNLSELNLYWNLGIICSGSGRSGNSIWVGQVSHVFVNQWQMKREMKKIFQDRINAFFKSVLRKSYGTGQDYEWWDPCAGVWSFQYASCN